jgi:site-specific recombinase XerD
VRIERGLDEFLDWRQLERDATPRSVDSYRRILWKLAEAYPEARLDDLTTSDLRAFLGEHWRERSAATRSNVISVLHSFFTWAETEDLIEHDPSRKIRRPPKRKPDIYRPSLDELARLRAVALPNERPALLLMEGAGLRRSEVIGCRWADLDLVRGRARVHRKGQHWHWLPLDPDVVDELRESFRQLQPELDDHVFTVEVEQWVSAYERQRRRKDPKQAASDQALMRMVWRVCKRAGTRRLSPHQLRHGFANRFLRESGRDVVALQALMGHSRPDTIQQYTDEVELDELAAALEHAAETRRAQASPELTTLESEVTAALESLRWRRRESNPRPRTHRQNGYKLRLPFALARTAGVQPPYRRASHPLVSRLRRLALLRRQPVVDAATRTTGRVRSDASPNSVRRRVRVCCSHLL